MANNRKVLTPVVSPSPSLSEPKSPRAVTAGKRAAAKNTTSTSSDDSSGSLSTRTSFTDLVDLVKKPRTTEPICYNNPAVDCNCSYRATLREMYEKRVETDFTIVSTDGFEFPCHMAILSVKVPLFRQLFEKKQSWEYANKKYKLSTDMEMSSTAVDALLRYLYYGDTFTMEENLEIAFVMIRVGFFCRLEELMNCAIQIVLGKA